MTLGLVDSFFFWIMIPTISTDYSNAHCRNPEPNRNGNVSFGSSFDTP